MPQLEKILVPVDISDCSKHALQYAASLAETFGASLEILLVWETPAFMDPKLVLGNPEDSTTSLVEHIFEKGAIELENFVKTSLPDTKVELSYRMLDGRVADTITEVAEQKKVDLIVMGTHGRGTLAKLYLGSVAEKVVRKAKCPVLTVGLPK